MYVNNLVVRLTILFLTISLVPGVRTVWADKHQHQDAHQHTAPHGGQMVTAGRYHLEVVVKEHQTVQVYLYGDNMQPVAVPTPEATLYVRLSGGKNHTLTLKAAGSDAASLWATTTDVLRDAETFEAALRVALEGEPRNIRFTYQGEHAGAPHKHGQGR